MSDTNKAMVWIHAARPKTWAAAIVPVVVGNAAAVAEGRFRLVVALVTVICSLLIQIGTNFVNDLCDHLAGADTKERLGPRRAVASGLLSVRKMQGALVIVFALVTASGLYLVGVGGWPILVAGVCSMAAGIAYTAGPYPLAYHGLGDLFVFLFFGLVATIGSNFVQTLHLSPAAALAAVPIGALITNILVVNNYRDIAEDRASRKRTLAVIFGERFARGEYLALLLIAYASPFILFVLTSRGAAIFLPLLSAPLAARLYRRISTLRGTPLNRTLAETAQLAALYGMLLAIGLIL